MMLVDVLGIGAWSLAHRGWPALMAACAGNAVEAPLDTTRPSPSLLPSAERRRVPDGVAVALEVASEAVAMARSSEDIDAATLASVFTSAHGDLAIVDYLCATLATDATVLSPTRFHLSVHNAAAGHWSIAAGDRAPSTALAGGDDSFALGLLEAATMAIAEQRAVLLVAFDTPAVGLLAHATRSSALFGFALVLRPGGDDAKDELKTTRLSLTIETEAATMPQPVGSKLQPLALSSAAARAVALAEALASGIPVELRYPLGAALALSVAVRPGGTAPEQAAIGTIE